MACKHENVEEVGVFPKSKAVLDGSFYHWEPIEGVFERVEKCHDCKETRTDIEFEEKTFDNLKEEDVKRHNFKAREEYYTNGGSLVQKDGFGNWYWNGEQMDGKRLKQRMAVLGDTFGDQEVSSNFKEIAHAARRTAEKKRYLRTQKLEAIRDKWE